MACGVKQIEALDRLEDELRLVRVPSPTPFFNVIECACARIPLLSKAGRAARIERALAAAAWTDAALGLIELEMPAWRPRRLAYESGEWFCSLSRKPNLPLALDDGADGHHELMPLAILLAFLQARRMSADESILSVPVNPSAITEMICCDNFA